MKLPSLDPAVDSPRAEAGDGGCLLRLDQLGWLTAFIAPAFRHASHHRQSKTGGRDGRFALQKEAAHSYRVVADLLPELSLALAMVVLVLFLRSCLELVCITKRIVVTEA